MRLIEEDNKVGGNSQQRPMSNETGCPSYCNITTSDKYMIKVYIYRNMTVVRIELKYLSRYARALFQCVDRCGAWNWRTMPLPISLQLQPVFRDLTMQAVASTEIHVHMNIIVFPVFLFRTKNYPGQYKCTLRAKCFAMRVAWPIVYSGQVWGKVKILGHAESFSPLFKTPEIVGRIYSFNSILVSKTLTKRMPVNIYSF